MIKTNAVIFAALFACCLDPNSEKRSNLHKQAADTTVIDGPYVLYRNDSVFVNYIVDSSGVKAVRRDSMSSSAKNNVNLQINTDLPGKTFAVQLKQKLSNEKSEWNGVKKMLVISDIEGNFEAFRKLLQGNQVIDENFNWTFGKDHLVLVGDFVDMIRTDRAPFIAGEDGLRALEVALAAYESSQTHSVVSLVAVA